MPGQPAQSSPPLVLIADAHEWSARSLVSILTPRGYVVVEVHSGSEVLGIAAARQPDAIVLQQTLPETDVLSLVRTLRAHPRVPAETPILVAAAGPTSRPARLAALRAGANELWSMPMDTEEMALRLDAHLRAKLAAGRARDEGLVDSVTGLYNYRGLAVRARDLASHASRRLAALACVVFDLDLNGDESPEAAAELHTALETIGQTLKQGARESDAVARVGPTRFAILAPDTNARSAMGLANRVGRLVAQAGATRPRRHPLRVRAGYHGVDDFRASGLEPLDLLERATAALPVAEAGSTPNWIQSFQPGS